jgi:putative ABC transport system permease protein
MGMIDQLALDFRFGVRTLRKHPAFTLAAVVTLALATGATTAIFSIVNSVLLRPLPFTAPERLAQVQEIAQVGGAGPVLAADLVEFRKQSSTFEAFTSYGLTTRHLQGSNGSERLSVVMADPQFFALLGVSPVAGRAFDASDRGSVVVISEGLWARVFDRNPGLIGQSIALEGNVFDPVRQRTVIERRQFTVVGVMPARFQFPYGAASVYAAALPETQSDLWMLDDRPRGGGRWSVTGRLKEGVTLEAARAELTVIEQRLDVMTPSPYRPLGVVVTPLADDVLASVRPLLWMLFGAVGLVLVAACANVANLLLARTITRAREVATRAALGAGRVRLMRQFLTESLLLSLCGGLAGAAVAWWGTRLLITVGAAKIPRAHEVALDWGAFGFLLLVCVGTALVFGLAPALSAARADVQVLAKESAGRTTSGGAFGHLRDALVVIEVALAFVLASGAVMVMSELARLRTTNLGMSTANVMTFHVTPRLEDADYFRIEERVRQLPGVEAAGLIHMVPLQNWGGIGTFNVKGTPPTRDASRLPTAELRSITPGYFETLGIPLRGGRLLSERDSIAVPLPILINESFARLYLRDREPIGVELDRGVIVGVVGDVRQVSVDQPAGPQIYSAVNRSSGIAPDIGMTVLVRTSGQPDTIVSAVRESIRQLHPNVAIFQIKTMDQIVSDALWELNLYRWLIGLFASLALILSAIGLYGVISYTASSRVREFAVRLALGSNPGALARTVVMRGIALTVIGLTIGVGTAILVAKLFTMLPTTFGPDPGTFALISIVLLGISGLACAVPALRVSRVDPAAALRHE